MAKVIIMTGATASGKSNQAIEHARAHNGVIINADALQQYTDLPILSARPLLDNNGEYAGIQHALYGILPPTAISDVKQWANDVVALVAQCHENDKTPIIVGGTGMYIYTLTHGLSPIPDMPPAPHYPQTTAELYRELLEIDPIWAQKNQPTDRQRIIRGLNVFHHTQKPLSEWHLLPPKPYLQPNYQLITIDCPAQQNRANIAHRLNRDFAKMQAEMLEFHQQNPNLTEKTPIFRILGAWQLWQWAGGKLNADECQKTIYTLTCQYAKRQRTFIRNKLQLGNNSDGVEKLHTHNKGGDDVKHDE